MWTGPNGCRRGYVGAAKPLPPWRPRRSGQIAAHAALRSGQWPPPWRPCGQLAPASSATLFSWLWGLELLSCMHVHYNIFINVSPFPEYTSIQQRTCPWPWDHRHSQHVNWWRHPLTPKYRDKRSLLVTAQAGQVRLHYFSTLKELRGS